jgi:hypothetical protein
MVPLHSRICLHLISKVGCREGPTAEEVPRIQVQVQVVDGEWVWAHTLIELANCGLQRLQKVCLDPSWALCVSMPALSVFP